MSAHVIHNKKRTKPIVLVNLLALTLILWLLVIPANAVSVVGHCDAYYSTHARGVYGWTNTMNNPALTARHVASFYVQESAAPHDDWQELGHYRQVGWSSAKYVWSIQIAGAYWDGDGPASPDGSDHYYHLYNDHSVGGGQWQWYFLVDGNHLWTLNTQINLGEVLASSERLASGDSNWAHFWNLNRMNQYGTWSVWPNGHMYYDSDTGYRYNSIGPNQFTVIPG